MCCPINLIEDDKYMIGHLLVMTACIDPGKNSRLVVRSSPELRLLDYKKSLQYWLSKPDKAISHILFLENSGSDLEELISISRQQNPYGKCIEFLRVPHVETPLGVSYGYNELDMLDFAVSNSEFMKRSKYFIKVTGRLIFPNLERLLKALPVGYKFAVDCRKNSYFVRHPQNYVTTQLMILSVDFYKRYLLYVKHELNEDLRLVENLLFQTFMLYKQNEGSVLRWPINCDPVGMAAHWDKDYASFKQLILNKSRGLCRIVMPWWWV